MNARVLIYPSLLLAAFTVLVTYLQHSDLSLIAAGLLFASLLLLLVALRRPPEGPQIPPEFQAKLARFEQQYQSQLQMLANSKSQVGLLEADLDEQKARGEALLAQMALYEAALHKAKVEKQTRDSQGAGEQAVLQFVRSMQGRGRFLDFLMADIHKLSDAQVGAAARIVHQGLRPLIEESFGVKALNPSEEGRLIPLDPLELGRSVKLLHSRGDTFPSEGRLLHKGWQASHVKLPQSQRQETDDERLILAQAEVDVGERESESTSARDGQRGLH